MEYVYRLKRVCITILCCGQAGTDTTTPDEQCGLLEQGQQHPHQHQHGYDSLGFKCYRNGMNANYPSQQASAQKNQAMEQETLRRIVERTAENLIDVTGAGMERLQQADLAERTDEYQGVVGRMGELDEASQRLMALPLPGSMAINDIFNDSTPAITSTHTAKMQQWSEQVEEVINNTQVNYIGEMVVSLTWTITE
ncbi:hypothetical protein BDF19DRAFT_416516 [Syncephalis fuscata]|nr:hypothetical protein BDF19DRAFT_416516 [Syncephalis fuscata]